MRNGSGQRKARAILLALSFLAIGGILALHYTAPLRALGMHDVLRRFFYLPVVAAAIMGGVRLGLLAAGMASLGYIPHLLQLAKAGDRMGDHLMELVLLAAVAALVGAYADSTRLARAVAAERGRLAALAEVALGVMGQVEGPLQSIEGQAESLSGPSTKGGGAGSVFAVWAIRSEALRIRRLLEDLRQLGRAGEPAHPSKVNLSALVMGIAEDVSAARPARSPLQLQGAPVPIEARVDRAALAYALRSLLLAIWDAVPPPAWVGMELAESRPGLPVVRIRARSESGWLPDLQKVVSGVFGPGTSEYQFHHALCVHLLRAQGAKITFERLSAAEVRVQLEFRSGRSGRRHPRGRSSREGGPR